MFCSDLRSFVFVPQDVDSGVIPWFAAAAKTILEDMPAEEALSRALAKITGHSVMQVCSLIH